jgi:uncharacterized protein (DUF488 family)
MESVKSIKDVLVYYRRKLLLAILEKSPNRQLSKIKLQKILFLICNQQKEPDYCFVPYHYGGFSFQANKDLSVLCSFYKIIEEDELGWKLMSEDNYFIQLKPRDAQIVLEQLSNSVTSDSELIEEIYGQYPYFAINSEWNVSNEIKEIIEPTRRKIHGLTDDVLYTIGYEGISIDEYLNLLVLNNIHVLCDVRKNPQSMKYGFNKKQLQSYCNGLKIKYIHLPELGIESENRKELSDLKSYQNLFADYAEQLPSKQDQIYEIVSLMKQYHRVALTCFEKEVDYCHRSCISRLINHKYNYEVRHL